MQLSFLDAEPNDASALSHETREACEQLDTSMDIAQDLETSATQGAANSEETIRKLEMKILAAAFELRRERALVKKQKERARAIAAFRIAIRKLYLKRFCID